MRTDGVVEIITERKRRRRWSLRGTLQLVAEASEPGAMIRAVAARGGTDIARLWTYVRDDRPFNGPASPGAVFHYSHDRGGEHLQGHPAGHTGILRADAYGG